MAISSANAESRFDALSFDLFGTLVFVDATRLPRATIDGQERIVTIPDLAGKLAALDGRASVEDFIAAAFEVAAELAKRKAVDNVEVPSQQRFVRILTRLGLGGNIDAVARALSEQHMRTLADAVVCPPDRVGLLRQLGHHFRLVLISNFDHADTARAILRRDRLEAGFDSVLISEDLGLCKPGAAIFAAACRRVNVEPARCLHVGDSWSADIEGASGAGLEALWVSAEAGDQENLGIAAGRIADVSELPLWLGLRARAKIT